MKTRFHTPFAPHAHWSLAAVCAGLLGASSLSAAIIVEDFDPFPGSAADPGWLTPWVGENATITTSSANPIFGGGQYVNISNNSSTGNQNYGMRRRIDSSVLNAAARHTVSWDFRLNDGAAIFNGPNNNENRLQFGATTVNQINTTNDWTWQLGLVGSDADYGSGAVGRTFYAYNNPGPTTPGSPPFFGSGNLLDTGVVLNEGEIYSFRVVVDPDSQSYDLTITSDAGQSFSASGLGFRNKSGLVGDRIVFAGNLPQGGANRVNFSVDNLVLTPEPGRALLLLLGGLGLLARRRRR